MKQVNIPDGIPQGGKKPRGISGTSSPYFDLDSSIKVVEAIHVKGGGSASPDQLAAWLGYSTTRSGTYLVRIAAARSFGLIEGNNTGGFTATDRGRTILAPVMPNDSVNAKVDAFLSIELFSKVYEQFRGQPLPPEAGLKNLFLQTYKILPDRVNQSVRVFLNSAEQAGFFTTTKGERTRLVKPALLGGGRHVAEPEKETDHAAATSQDRPRNPAGDAPGSVHSAIIGLLRDLPPPGTHWHPKKKQRFLDAFKASIDFIYPEEDEQ